MFVLFQYNNKYVPGLVSFFLFVVVYVVPVKQREEKEEERKVMI